MSVVEREPLEAARQARHALGVGVEGPLPGLLRLLEEGNGLAVSVLDLPEAIACAYARVDDQGFLFSNSRLSDHDLRFALAHAYGHHALGRGDTVSRHEDVFAGGADVAANRANRFALEFLTPRPALTRSLERWDESEVDVGRRPEQLSRLARFFGVSRAAALCSLDGTEQLTYQGRRWRLPAAPGRGRKSGSRLVDLDWAARCLDELPTGATPSWPPLDDPARQPEGREARPLHLPAQMQRWALTAYARGLAPLERLAASFGLEIAEMETLLERAGVGVQPLVRDY